ncbi:MAG: multidrug transporter [Verrucomicrobiales bacterium]|nr:multidrug transporter [Verrucomicrobiales bacterium]
MLAIAIVMPVCAIATPANKRGLERHFGDLLPKRLNSCATCHVKADAHGAESLKDFPHNAFGDRLHQLGRKISIADRLKSVAKEDADKDGVSNLIELLSGSSPGSKGDTAKNNDALAGLLKRYEDRQRQYAWKPFETVKKPVPPNVPGAELRNPIDNFIAAHHSRLKLSPQSEAAKDILLRRVYLDLIGLNPTPEDRRAFLNDTSPEAYENVVASLLNRPEYGERWGRHWMDIWRYSDWAGYKASLRDSQRHIWHWRDWIVEALNEDKPYDRMIHEMLAADEIAPEDPDTLRATGYLARHYYANRQQWMDNVVTHTSQAFMGVTVGCAKCHDHMYDPIPQQDYYAMRAVFESYTVRTDRIPGQLDIMKDGIPRVYDQSMKSKTYMFERGDERRPIKDKAIPPNVPAALGGSYDLQTVKLPRFAYQPEHRPFVIKELLAQAEGNLAAAKTDLSRKSASMKLTALKAELAAERIEFKEGKKSKTWIKAAENVLKLQREANLAEARSDIETSQKSQSTAEAKMKSAKTSTEKNNAASAMKKAKNAMTAAKKKLETAEKAMKAKLTSKYKSRGAPTYLTSSTGRRLAFAKWLTDKENPLTARVAMNHIWLRHFGQPIVPTVTEFGANGRPPSHPALLDWLAAEFMERDWSMKETHRLIVTSAAYRRSGQTDPANEKIDQDNIFLWRMPSRRMEGEIVRDNLLHVSGTIDRKLGGPDIDNKSAQTSKRRSIYLRHAHEKLVEFVQIFDGPKVSECYMRDESVQPHQALALANSQLTFDQSKILADDLSEQTGKNDEQFVRSAYESVLSRTPGPNELDLCRKFLKNHAGDGRERLVMVLFNHNEFVTIR